MSRMSEISNPQFKFNAITLKHSILGTFFDKYKSRTCIDSSKTVVITHTTVDLLHFRPNLVIVNQEPNRLKRLYLFTKAIISIERIGSARLSAVT